MTSDEAEAAVSLDEQFWAELRTTELKFLWWPEYNTLTGKRMWLCTAVRAVSGRVIQVGSYADYDLATIRWYKPQDFVIEKLKH